MAGSARTAVTRAPLGGTGNETQRLPPAGASLGGVDVDLAEERVVEYAERDVAGHGLVPGGLHHPEQVAKAAQGTAGRSDRRRLLGGAEFAGPAEIAVGVDPSDERPAGSRGRSVAARSRVPGMRESTLLFAGHDPGRAPAPEGCWSGAAPCPDESKSSSGG